MRKSKQLPTNWKNLRRNRHERYVKAYQEAKTPKYEQTRHQRNAIDLPEVLPSKPLITENVPLSIE